MLITEIKLTKESINTSVYMLSDIQEIIFKGTTCNFWRLNLTKLHVFC